MSEGKERIVAEHPKAWVVRMVEGRGLKVAEKTLYWWSVHLERFLKFCRIAGAESSEIPEVVGDGAKPDFLPEQNQTVAQRLNSAWIQGQMALGVSETTQNLRFGW